MVSLTSGNSDGEEFKLRRVILGVSSFREQQLANFQLLKPTDEAAGLERTRTIQGGMEEMGKSSTQKVLSLGIVSRATRPLGLSVQQPSTYKHNRGEGQSPA